jgi:hypothetical protein
MPNPHFLFTAYHNSYKVVVKNLESLSVEQIQQIEAFVKERKGYFDFETYSFVIQRRISFDEFCKLMRELGMSADIEEYRAEQKQEPRVGFGQYKGLFYSELPDSYLLWLKNNYHGYDRDHIERELKARNL